MKKMFNLVLLIFIAVVGIIGLSNISTETVGADSIESNRNIDLIKEVEIERSTHS
ncbi:MAG: hypothetical protein IJR61_06640 [Clostridia bacterium]|nr:hypothetical protein [Clostridia bacterium]